MKPPVRMSFHEWLYRMSEDRVPSQARPLAITAAVFNVAGNDAMARLAGMDFRGRGDKTYTTWKNHLIAEGWLIAKSLGKGGGPRVQLLPAYRGHPVELGDWPDEYTPSLPPSGKTRRKRSPQTCPAHLRERVLVAFDYTCQRCGFRCAPGEVVNHNGRIVDSSSLHVDRLTPGSRGGRYTEDNVTLACRVCNCLRGDKLPAVGMSLSDAEGQRGVSS